MPEAVAADRPGSAFVAGAFDMANYGNLLFPLIAAFRLQPFGIEVVPVCPTGRCPVFADAMDCRDLNEMMCAPGDPCAILIGGGNTFHDQPMTFMEDYRTGDMQRWASTGLWIGATLAAAIRDVPVVWNAPGIPIPIAHARRRDVVSAALRAASYVSVRDRGSVETLEPPADVEVAVVPDTVADLARMWPRPTLAKSFKSLIERKGGDPADRHLAVHVRTRSLGKVPPGQIAAWIDEFAERQNLVPVLIAIGPGLGDATTVRQLSQLLRVRHVLLDDPRSLREIAAAIAYSRLYIGASLHAYVTSAAYDVPGVLVAIPARRKFGGFLEHIGRPGDLARDWAAAFQMGSKRLNENAPRMPESVFTALDVHWDRIRAAASDRHRKRPDRMEFLRSYLRFGVDVNGPGWALRPFLTHVGRAASVSERSAQGATAAR